MRRYLSRLFAIRPAYRDLKDFLSRRRPHQYGLFALSVTLVGLTLWAFSVDSHFVPAYHPNIVYFESWSNNRTDAEIRADQKRDAAKKAQVDAAFEHRRDQQRQEFKRLDDKLRAWGI